MDKNFKVLIVASVHKVVYDEMKIIPRVGDKIDVFYHPFPTVTQILLKPSYKTMKRIGFENYELDAIVYVD